MRLYRLLDFEINFVKLVCFEFTKKYNISVSFFKKNGLRHIVLSFFLWEMKSRTAET